MQVFFYGAQSAVGPSITLPGAITELLDVISSKEGFGLGFGDLAAPPSGTPSPIYIAVAKQDSSTLVMTAQAILLIPGPLTATATATATASATPTVTATPTHTATPTATVTPTPAILITFAGSSALADYSAPVTTVTVNKPAAAATSDIMLAQIVVWDGAGTNVPTAPGGWNFIRRDFVSNNGNKMTSWLYYKVATASEPSTYSWTISSQYAAGVIGAWQGASSVTPIDTSSGAT